MTTFVTESLCTVHDAAISQHRKNFEKKLTQRKIPVFCNKLEELGISMPVNVKSNYAILKENVFT